ncbi:MAG: helix-turn-helix domain-containing protein [Proteobacteria bacterium]|nr:helix-turn-helix domain-containing protein [Pseudomonadota bacterium]
MLKVSQTCIYKWAARGVLPHFKLENSVEFSRDDVLDFLKKRSMIHEDIEHQGP